MENAKGEDNDGRRRELIRELVRDAVGVTVRDPDVFGTLAHRVIWRGRAARSTSSSARDWLVSISMDVLPMN